MTDDNYTLPDMNSDGDDAALDAIQNALDEIGGTTEAEVKIYTLPDGVKSKWAFLATTEPEQFSVDWLAQEYGPGTYRVHVRANGKLLANREIRIAGKKKDETKKDAPGFDGLAKMIMDAQEKNSALLVSLMMNKQERPSFLTPEVLVAMIGAAAPFLKALREMATPATTNQLSAKEILDLIHTGMEMAGKDAGKSETNMHDVFSELIKSIMPTMAQQAMNPVQQLPHQNLQQLPHQNLQQENQQMNPMAMYIKKQLDPLMKAAEAGENPNNYIEHIENMVPPAVLDNVLSQPDPIAVLAHFHPDAEKHRGWLATVLHGLTNDGEPEHPVGATDKGSAPHDATGKDTNTQ